MSTDVSLRRVPHATALILMLSACAFQAGGPTPQPSPTGTPPAESLAPSTSLTPPPSPSSSSPEPSATAWDSAPVEVGLAACQDAMAVALMEPDAEEVSRITATRAAVFDSAEVLVQEAELIVVGVVGSMAVQWTPPGTPDPTQGPGEEDPAPWVVLSRSFQVETVLKGELGADEIIPLTYLVEMPGEIPVVEYDARPLEAGDRYLLFLDQGSSRDIWFAIGGPQGEFEVVDGHLRMATTCHETGLEFHGLSVDEAAELIGSFTGER